MSIAFGLLASAALIGAGSGAAHTQADARAAAIEAGVMAAVRPLLAPRALPPSATEFAHLVRTEDWTEVWPNEGGVDEARAVTGEIWTAAIQAALDRHHAAYLPARTQPYTLDGPLVLRSGDRLVADPRAEIRLKPGTNTCMVRNAGMVSGQSAPFPAGARPDQGISVEGGIWSTLRTAPQAANGNDRGRADARDSIPGAHGVLLFNNVRGLAVRGVTIRQGTPFGIHLAAVSGFLVEGVTFEEHRRDGVHLGGLCRDGIVRDIRGVTHDDFVALNGWDWRQCSMVFGPIANVLVEHIRGNQGVSDGGPFPDGSAEIRLLAGTKCFPDGTRLACDIENAVFRDIQTIRTVKMYDQPNLEIYPGIDRADPIGRIRGVAFSNIDTAPTGDPLFQVHSDVDGMRIEGVTLRTAQLPAGYALVGIGPQSATYKLKQDDPAAWAEIFSPNKDCTMRNLRMAGIRVAPPGANSGGMPVEDPYALVRVLEQRPNPDYPKTLPRGGTGKGVWIR